MLRRTVLKSLAAAPAAAGYAMYSGCAMSAEGEAGIIEQGVAGIVSDGQRLQLLPEQLQEVTIETGSDYESALVKTVNAINELEESNSSDPRRWLLLDQLYAALARLNETVRSERPDETEEARPQYSSLRKSYQDLFDQCEVRTDKKATVNWYLNRIGADVARSRYRRVEASTGVKWYFIGIAHALEASLNFQGHLHNGDPLTRRTRQVPSGRPKIWNPPSEWESSAEDALSEVMGNDDWSVPHMLYLLEGYNGYAYHKLGINSPYLWSFSGNYSKGKYVRDHVYDPNAVSKQCGAGVLLKEMKRLSWL
ncbi:hypothetical protein NKJ36_27255 [Mesorhizobium sp. M0142]|uniref:hypothetical protein n=1 Tax=unclassified Mesorhizobium TaxID=325217 RepID=UPI0033356702